LNLSLPEGISVFGFFSLFMVVKLISIGVFFRDENWPDIHVPLNRAADPI